MDRKPVPLVPHQTLEELGSAYRTCQNAQAKTRWQIIWPYTKGSARCLALRAKATIKSITETTGFSLNRVYKLVQQYNREDPSSPCDQHWSGPRGNRPIPNQKERQTLWEALQVSASDILEVC